MSSPPHDPAPPDQVAADRRVLVVLWLAVSMGVVLLVGVMAYLVSAGVGDTVEGGDLFFYLNAGLSVAAIAGAFAAQRGLEARLPATGTYAEAAALIRGRVLLSAALIEGSALFAAVAFLVTGEWINLAFVVPFFAFMLLFFPSEGRYAYWLALRERR